MPTLLILRGLPGSGKTKLAEEVTPSSNVSNDQYFEALAALQGKTYSEVFSPNLLPTALEWCFNQVEERLKRQEELVIVHNVFSRRDHVTPYIQLGEKYGYTVHVITVENHHEKSSVHNVPSSAVKRMLRGWQRFLPREFHEWENRRTQGE
jgi:predicted kinase